MRRKNKTTKVLEPGILNSCKSHGISSTGALFFFCLIYLPRIFYALWAVMIWFPDKLDSPLFKQLAAARLVPSSSFLLRKSIGAPRGVGTGNDYFVTTFKKIFPSSTPSEAAYGQPFSPCSTVAIVQLWGSQAVLGNSSQSWRRRRRKQW